jgi:hypothetical protein
MSALAAISGTSSHSRISRSKATTSGSFSASHVSAASKFCKDLEMVGVADWLACIHINEHGHRTIP